MFSVNLGATLAQRGRRVALIDLDLGMRNMDLYLGMENRVVFNIMDVMTGMCRLSKALLKVQGFDSLYFMAASPRSHDGKITDQHMSALCELLRKYFDYIIIDTGAGAGDLLTAAAKAADTGVIVTEPEIAALRDGDTIASILGDCGLRDICMVINKVDLELVSAGILPDVESIINSTGTPVVGIIQLNRDIRISTSRGTPVVCKTETDTARNFLAITGRIIQD